MTSQPGSTSVPWGYKVTAHIYVAGTPHEDVFDAIADAIGEVVPDAQVGLDFAEVPTRPYQQGES